MIRLLDSVWHSGGDHLDVLLNHTLCISTTSIHYPQIMHTLYSTLSDDTCGVKIVDPFKEEWCSKITDAQHESSKSLMVVKKIQLLEIFPCLCCYYSCMDVAIKTQHCLCQSLKENSFTNSRNHLLLYYNPMLQMAPACKPAVVVIHTFDGRSRYKGFSHTTGRLRAAAWWVFIDVSKDSIKDKAPRSKAVLARLPSSVTLAH